MFFEVQLCFRFKVLAEKPIKINASWPWVLVFLSGRKTESKMIILNTHHWIVLSDSGWSLWRVFSNEMCFGEPAERGTGENKANWSRKCHSLTLRQQAFNQKHRQRTTLNVYG